MTTLSVTLSAAEADRLAELAKREGATPEQFATAAVQARLQDDAAWQAEILAGLAELDRGEGVPMEQFEQEMDAYMAGLRARQG
jgi:predicted transcriptional regulator